MTHHFGAAALGAALCFASASGCNDARETATADLHDLSGRRIGSASLRSTDEGILVTIEADSLPPGEHGFHVHEHGSCEPPGFESAGTHFNPTDAHHGLAHGMEHSHVGDMVNLFVDPSGRTVAHRVIVGATLHADDDETSNSLLREGGTALVIHAAPDDYITDPAGASGPRIACGVIEAGAT
jgi:superoxide dismutase, Cu-Zn family